MRRGFGPPGGGREGACEAKGRGPALREQQIPTHGEERGGFHENGEKNRDYNMTGIELLIGVSAFAGKEALKRVIATLYDRSGDKAKKVLRTLKNQKELGKLFQQLGKVRKVKTLGQLDKAIDLTTFYCDSHVYTKKQRTRIRSFGDLKTDGNVLIEGIAGQGKSIFLRYLCSVEALRGEFIPIFAELRRIQENQSLTDFLIKTLKTFHIDADSEVLSALGESGRLILMLDAFDEVRDDAKERILGELEDFAAQHEAVRIVVTSRPESGIAACRFFEVFRLSDLEGEEWAIVVNKVTEDVELAAQLIEQVKKHKGGIRELLLTPLLVTLLVIRYKSYQELPEQLADFYDSLFQVLLQRHDGIKPGYRRTRRCGMNDQQYRQAFEAFCFISKHFQERQLRQQDIYKTAESALKDRRLQGDPSGFIDDIVKVTCLLVKDGEEYRFIHKSVQEYYAAAYIAQKTDFVAEKLYVRIFSGEWWRFQQELRFLAEIDRYRYAKFGVLKSLSNSFSIEPIAFMGVPNKAIVEHIIKKILDCAVEMDVTNGCLRPRSFHLPNFGALTMEVTEPFDKLIWARTFDRLRPKKFNARPELAQSIKTFGALIELLKSEGEEIELEKAAEQIAEKLFKVARKALQTVQSEESFDPILSLVAPEPA